MEASERFGVRWTGTHDFGGSGVTRCGDRRRCLRPSWRLSRTLPPPTVKSDLPDAGRVAAAAGAKHLQEVGCVSCHIPALPLKVRSPSPIRQPYDMAGTLRAGEVKQGIVIDLAQQPFAQRLKKNDKGEWLVPLFGDLKRHMMVDDQVNALGNELQAMRFVERDVFETARLWSAGSTAPYGHRGDFRSLDEVIAAHGGEGRFARDAYLALPKDDQQTIIAFLRSLVIEAQ